MPCLSLLRGLALLTLLPLTACDSAEQREHESLRAELEAARAELEAARAELQTARAELHPPRLRPPQPQDPLAVPADPAATPTPPALIDDPAAIRCAAPGACTITRAAYQAFLENPGQLTRAARVVPHTVNGVHLGLKLYGLRPTSPFGRIGLKNGDLITALNEISLAGGVEPLLRAYPALHAADRLTFRGERLGTPFTLQLTITP